MDFILFPVLVFANLNLSVISDYSEYQTKDDVDNNAVIEQGLHRLTQMGESTKKGKRDAASLYYHARLPNKSKVYTVSNYY